MVVDLEETIHIGGVMLRDATDEILEDMDTYEYLDVVEDYAPGDIEDLEDIEDIEDIRDLRDLRHLAEHDRHTAPAA